MITRIIEPKIIDDLSRRKAIVILGARQVGKTTLIECIAKHSTKVLHLNCDDSEDRIILEDKSSTALRTLISDYDIVLIDEAQRIRDVGLVLKKIVDLKLQVKVIATGSSSLDLANGIAEPATGRTIEYQLFPFSLRELANDTSIIEEGKNLAQRMVYGLYPDVVNYPSDAKRTLMELTNNYLYKDILTYKGFKKPELLQKLLQALALQLGSEVSYNELARLIGADKETVENYIGLLEKCYVVFRVGSYSRNLRTEIRKGKKVYFYDNGVRNAILANFAPLDLRNDVGALWENLMISERYKRHIYANDYTRMYFWRTHEQKEIDLIEEVDGRLECFEFKWGKKVKAKPSLTFLNAYPETPFRVVNPENYWEFV